MKAYYRSYEVQYIRHYVGSSFCRQNLQKGVMCLFEKIYIKRKLISHIIVIKMI